MTHEMDHPTDEALAAWVDARIDGDAELVLAARPVTSHLAGCAGCRGRVAELQELVASLRAEPAAVDPAVLADQRSRVLETIERSHVPRVTRSPARWWIPVAAAAAVAALLVARGGVIEREVVEQPSETAALPVVVAAERAAAEVATTVDSAEPEPVAASLPGTSIADADLVEEFAALSPDDQDAILTELAAADFDE